MTIPLGDNTNAEGPSQPKRRRAHHKRSRAGCKTCNERKRRVRCDEARPLCHRCVSSGRICEGYKDSNDGNATGSSQSSAHTIVTHPKLLIPRKNPEEIRSYNYFLEVTGPALSGLFDADFWCRELPKVCVADPALWHAVVALGSAHEACGYGDRQPETKPQYTLCLQQYSAAISSLRDLGSLRSTDRWRAVLASTIFTCICAIQGLYQQALVIHAAAGCSLIREMETEDNASRPQPITRDQHETLACTPIDLRQVKNLLFGFEGLAQVFKTGGYADDRNAASLGRTDSFGYWSFYKSSDISPECPKHLMAAFLARARRAAESLQNGLGLWWQENRDDIHGLYGVDAVAYYEKLVARQAAHVRCYKELQRTFRKFQENLDMEDFAIELCMLELVQLTSSLYLLSDPERPDPVVRHAEMPLVADRIIELSESILTRTSPSSGKLALIPTPLTSGSLFLIAHSGFSISSRQRAVELLRRPRLEGFWEPALSASLAEAMWTREQGAKESWTKAKASEEYVSKESGFGCVDAEMPLRFRVCSAKLQFSDKKREAVVTMMTKMDEQDGVPPVQRTIYW